MAGNKARFANYETRHEAPFQAPVKLDKIYTVSVMSIKWMGEK